MLGPLVAALIAAGIQAAFSVGATVAQNQYNAPKAMLKRLRKAGLPLAYAYQGKVAQQSSVPQLSIDPFLGTTAEIQSKKTKAETKALDIQNEEDQATLDFRNKVTTDPNGVTATNRYHNLSSERNEKKAASWVKEHEEKIKRIQLQLEQEAFRDGVSSEMRRQALAKAKQQVLNLMEQKGLMAQLKKIRGMDEFLNTSLLENINNLPQWIQGFAKVLMMAFNKKI